MPCWTRFRTIPGRWRPAPVVGSTWFLETYTESEAALLVNAGVTILALYRFLGY